MKIGLLVGWGLFCDGYVTNFRVINKEMFGDTIMKFKFNSIMFILHSVYSISVKTILYSLKFLRTNLIIIISIYIELFENQTCLFSNYSNFIHLEITLNNS